MTLIEAAKLTLEALESIPEDVEGYLPESCTDAVIALRTAIEAAEKQEPVTQCMEHGECFGGECIYATPPAAQRQWVGLTATDWNAIAYTKEFCAGAEWAEAKLKEKNT
jgi:hypothetical protein